MEFFQIHCFLDSYIKNMQTFTDYFACHDAFPILPFPLVSLQVANSVTDKEME